MEVIVGFVIGIIVGAGTTSAFIFFGFMASRIAAMPEYDEFAPITEGMVDTLVEKVNESIAEDKKEEIKS